MNCNICFILAAEAEKNGVSIIWDRFPKIAIYRAFQKAYVNYDTPEHILRKICLLGDVQFDKAFGEVTERTIAELTDESFASWVKEGCGTTEETIYKAATKIGTFLEFKEIQRHMNGGYSRKYEEIVEELCKYDEIPGFKILRDTKSDYFKLFEAISKLRNQNRWAAYSYLVDCSVLGHLFDTAVFAYLMALEKGETESVATKCFFMGIFHDVPEAFTRDIPSPIKDEIPGFRELTEKYELQMMKEHVYPFLSETTADALREVMFENDHNAEFKKMMKGADYMSAVSEIWRQLKAGTRDESFIDSIERHQKKFESNSVAELTPNTKELLDWMIRFANRLKL